MGVYCSSCGAGTTLSDASSNMSRPLIDTTNLPKHIVNWQRAVHVGNVPAVAALNDQYPEDVIESEFSDGSKAIHMAIKNNDNKMIFFLLDCGCNASAQDGDGNTPLHFAAQHENFNLVALLIHHLADPALTNSQGKTPLQVAIQTKNREIIEILDVDEEVTGHGQGGEEPEQIEWDDGCGHHHHHGDHCHHGHKKHHDEEKDEESWHSITSQIFSDDENDGGENEPIWTWSKRGFEQSTKKRTATDEGIICVESLPTSAPASVLNTPSAMNVHVMATKPKTQSALDLFAGLNSSAKNKTKKKPAPAATNLAAVGEDAEMSLSVQEGRSTRMSQLQAESAELLELSGWLDKKKIKAPYNYQRRWFIVRGSYVLWADTQINTDKPSLPRERQRFNQAISLMMVNRIEPMESRAQNKFKLLVGMHGGQVGEREYTFKAQSTVDRNFWVENLRKHKEHFDKMLNFLD